MAIHERIREVRRELGFSQAEMAEKFGTIYKTYQRYEQGKNFPTVAFLLEIAKIGYNLHWLITGEGEKKFLQSVQIDPLFKEIEQWIKEGAGTDPKILNWFEVEFKRSFPEFVEWTTKSKKT